MRPRDLAKIGQFVLDHGVWQGRPIVSAAWIEESITPHIKGEDPFFYGYQWWLGRSLLNRREVSWAAGFGWGGQRLFIVPNEDIVVLVMAGRYNLERFTKGTTAALAQAREEARRLNRPSVYPEHVLLAVIGLPQMVAGWVLAQLGVTLDAARDRVEACAGRGDRPVQEAQIPLSPVVNRVLALASDEAARLRHHWLGTEHLLLALFQLHDVPEGVPVLDVMRQFRLDADQLRELLTQELALGRRRIVSQKEGTGDHSSRVLRADVGSTVLNDFVLPAVLR